MFEAAFDVVPSMIQFSWSTSVSCFSCPQVLDSSRDFRHRTYSSLLKDSDRTVILDTQKRNISRHITYIMYIELTPLRNLRVTGPVECNVPVCFLKLSLVSSVISKSESHIIGRLGSSGIQRNHPTSTYISAFVSNVDFTFEDVS